MSDQSVPVTIPSQNTSNAAAGADSGVRATILHISDLHFGSGLTGGPANQAIVEMLNGLMKPEPGSTSTGLDFVLPDYIVVSGDLVESPTPWAMKRAYNFICTLAEKAGVRPEHVLVIPGNHDYKIMGNLGLGRASRVPFEVYFRGDWQSRGDWKSRRNWITNARGARWRQFTRLIFNSLVPGGTELGDQTPHVFDPDRGVVIFGIQSTPVFQSFATGQVTSEQVSRLTNELVNNRMQWADLFKVVAVHHHPLPMSYDKTNARARLEESGMVFYNAGGFLRELSRHGIDLILHGHKHVAGFRRAVYDFEDQTRRSIGVMAAGSATRNDPGDDLGNEFNVIRIYDDDRVEIDRWYFSPTVRRKDESHIYDLYDLNDVREHRTQRHHRRFKLTIGRFTRTVNLTRDGYSRIDFHLKDCQVCKNQKLVEYKFDDFVVERPCYLRDPEVVPEGTTLVDADIAIEPDSHPWRQRGKVSFGEIVTTASDPFDLMYTFRMMNGHALTSKEFQRRYKGIKYEGEPVKGEFASIDCERACEILKLVINFPDDFDMGTIQKQYAQAYYYPRTSAPNSPMQPHDVETRRIKSKLSVENKAFVLEVNAPIPEFVYRVVWNYKPGPAGAGSSMLTERDLLAARERLIEIARNAETSEQSDYQRVRDLLLKFLESVTRNYPERAPTERLDISLTVFDDEKSVLRFAATGAGKISELFEETLMTGEGCAGFCFEKAKVVYYDRATDRLKYYLDPDEVALGQNRPSSLKKAQVLIAIPWLVPGLDIPMGAVTIYSLARNSRLLPAILAPEGKKEAEATNFIGLINALGTAIIAVVKGKTVSEGEGSDTQSNDSLGRNG